VRVGFVGCGRHAMRALYPVLVPAGLELVATCARHLERAEAAARAYGAPAAYDDLAAMLGSEELDGVLASLPHDQYESVIGRCVDARIPVWSEKPAAGDAESLRRLESKATDAGVPVMVGYMKRFAPAYRQALRAAAEPGFGELSSLHMRFVVGAWADDLRDFVIDCAVHALDLLRFFAGEATGVRAAGRRAAPGRFAISLLLELSSGAVASAQLGTVGSFAQECEQLDIFGAGGACTVRNVDTMQLRPPEGPASLARPTYTVPGEASFSASVMGFLPELRHWRAVVQDGAVCESDLGSARRSLELAESVLAALEVRTP
jgi:predicted dehydrogenase